MIPRLNEPHAWHRSAYEWFGGKYWHGFINSVILYINNRRIFGRTWKLTKLFKMLKPRHSFFVNFWVCRSRTNNWFILLQKKKNRKKCKVSIKYSYNCRDSWKQCWRNRVPLQSRRYKTKKECQSFVFSSTLLTSFSCSSFCSFISVFFYRLKWFQSQYKEVVESNTMIWVINIRLKVLTRFS